MKTNTLLFIIAAVLAFARCEARDRQISFLDHALIAAEPVQDEDMVVWTYLPAGEDETRWSSKLTIQHHDGLAYRPFRKTMILSFDRLANVLPPVHYAPEGSDTILVDYAMRGAPEGVLEHVVLWCAQTDGGRVVVIDFRRRAYSDQDDFLARVKSDREAFVRRFVEETDRIKE